MSALSILDYRTRRNRIKVLYWDGYATLAIMGHHLSEQAKPRIIGMKGTMTLPI
jgi:hypothetical protein